MNPKKSSKKKAENPENNNNNLLKNLLKAFAEPFKTSYIHGIVKIFESKHNYLKSLWAFFLLFSFGTFIGSSCMSILS
jgi:hypothetical protein